MSNLINFNFENHELNTVVIDGQIWFPANALATALGFANPRQAIATHTDKDDVQKLDTIDTMGRKQKVNFVNESGMYALIFGSTKDEAKRFKRWVTSEVLPSIRKTGSYGEPKTQASIAPQSLTELAPITPFKSHMSANDSKAVRKEMEMVHSNLVPLIRQLADCYYDKEMAYNQISSTIAHYCGIKNLWWITLERLPTALTVLSIMKSEATAHKQMMHRLDDNARLALSYKTVNAIGCTGETLDDVEA